MMNTDNFICFLGVVEDCNDPQKIGRVRVRCFGIHTENLSSIPTEDLPWASVLLPTTSSGINGIGESLHGLLNGSWVVGFFRDGKDYQEPIIFGVIGSHSTNTPNTSQGFNDPNGVYPRETHINESDVNRLARNENLDKGVVDSVTKRQKAREENVKTASPKEKTWNEPDIPYKAVYGYNHVKETTSGHIIELDDTPNHERIHESHSSGTFREIHPSGSQVVKIKGDNYQIVAGSNYIYIKGNGNITLDGNMSTQINGDWDVNVKGNWNVNVDKNIKQSSGENTIHESANVHSRTASQIVDKADTIKLN